MSALNIHKKLTEIIKKSPNFDMDILFKINKKEGGEVDLFDRLESWYSRNGISIGQFFNNNSTEMGRDEMLFDFTDRMLTVQDQIKKDLRYAINSLQNANEIFASEDMDEEDLEEINDFIKECKDRYKI